jgi:hypothetical protein
MSGRIISMRGYDFRDGHGLISQDNGDIPISNPARIVERLEARIQRISGLEQKCRDALQYDSVFKQTILRKKAYEKICALVDFIGDSDSALSSVISQEQRQHLQYYFLAYGILQLMYSRQVALRDVIKTLDLPIPEPLMPGMLTTARDRIVGHPITSDEAAHVIVRHTLNENGFEYWSYYPGETRRGNIVEYEALIKAHLDTMEVGMRALYQHIAEFENERRREMRQDPLSPALHGIPYVMQQISAALVEERYGQIFNANAASLLSALDRFRAGLVKRCGEEFTAHEVDHVIEGVRMLQSLFRPKDTNDSNRYRIVADGVETNVRHLIDMAADIDEQEKDDLT